MKVNTIALIGGSGFVGRHLTRHLNNAGYRCRVLTRHSHRHKDLKVAGEMVEVNPFDEKALTGALEGCDGVVNLVGILNEAGRTRTFRRVHIELVETIVEACHQAGVKRLLHMSALQANQASGSSRYLRTKGEGENRAHTLGKPDIAVTSFRPSVIFGPDDSFLNRFAALLRIPGPMPLACPDSRFAPVYVKDVAAAFTAAVDDRRTFGKHYELCGPEEFTLEEIVRFVAQQKGMRKLILGLPDWASRLQAGILQYAPGKPFTPDNFLSLQTASVCSNDGLAALGIKPTSMKLVAPRFLGRADTKGLDELRRSASR